MSASEARKRVVSILSWAAAFCWLCVLIVASAKIERGESGYENIQPLF